MGSPVNHQPINGDTTKITVAVGRAMPLPQSVTLGAVAAKAATSLTVTALTSPIDAGNWLHFIDANGLEYLARVNTNAATGATSISVSALAEAIPNASTAQFPSELFDRSAVDLDQQYNTQEVITLNTGGDRQVIPTNSTKNVSAPGFYYWHNAGLQLCREAADNKNTIWLFIEYARPSTAYTKGEVLYGKGIISSLPRSSPADGFITSDMELQFTGPTTTVPPVPTA